MDPKSQQHPPEIIAISFSKMVERLGFYGMRSILVLYLVRGSFRFPEGKAMTIYSIFVLAAMLSPILGGIAGDFILKNKRTVSIIGGLIQALGCFILAFPELPVMAGLALIALGTGLYSPNIISMISSLYKERPERSDGAITIFYLAINIGAFLGAFIVGYICDEFSFSIGFIITGIMMLTSSLLLLFIEKSGTKEAGEVILETKEKTSSGIITAGIIISIFLIPFFWLIIDLNVDQGMVTGQKFGEAYSAISMVAPASVIIFGIILAIIWSFVVMSSLLKIGIGFLIYGLSLSLLFVAVSVENGIAFFLVIGMLLQGIAEMFISPTALAYISRHAPAKVNSLLIAIYLMIPGLLSYSMSFLFHYSNFIGSAITYFISISIVVLIAAVFFVLWALSKKSVEDAITAQNVF